MGVRVGLANFFLGQSIDIDENNTFFIRLQVNSNLKTLFNVQSIAQESGAALKELQRTFQGCLTFLKFFGVNIENWDPILVYICSTKLPKLTLS